LQQRRDRGAIGQSFPIGVFRRRSRETSVRTLQGSAASGQPGCEHDQRPPIQRHVRQEFVESPRVTVEDDPRFNPFDCEPNGQLGRNTGCVGDQDCRRAVKDAAVKFRVTRSRLPAVLVTAVVQRIGLPRACSDQPLAIQTEQLGDQFPRVIKDEGVGIQVLIVISLDPNVGEKVLGRPAIKPDAVNPIRQKDAIRVAVAVDIGEQGMDAGIEDRRVNRISL
jgi:hypothetical protein